eukprot:PITA_03074
MIIQPLGDEKIYIITNVYGPKKSEDKLNLLTSLEELRERHPVMPWILGGDFNMIRSLTEKKGGTRSLGGDSIAFQNFLINMKLVDTETTNGTFTWNNKRGGALQVASKLDRFIISKDLFLTGPNLNAFILPFGGSNHWPIQLEASFIGTSRNRPFRFENVWLTHPNFITNIGKWWLEDMPIQGTKMFLLQQRLKHIKLRLEEWNKNEFGNIFNAKREVEQKLQKINQILIKEGFTKERKMQANSLQQEWDKRCQQEEIFWKQKSRVQWIKEGEGNTRFFHKSMEHRAHNRSTKLIDPQGKELSTHKDIESIMEDNYNLNWPVTEEEVNEVIKEMHNGKAPRPDGFNVDLFKACWEIVKHDILEVVEDSRNSKIVLKALNASFIALIPKQEKAMTPDRFKPISLCNAVYKIISKVISSRLKSLLPMLVFEEQT